MRTANRQLPRRPINFWTKLLTKVTIATSVAALRMINDKHWQSDVVAGAGFGILSAHLAYLTHRNRWGRKPHYLDGTSFMPTWLPGGGMGLGLTWHPTK